MKRLFLPVLFLLSAVGLFVLYIDPTYQGSKEIRKEVASYDDALSKSKELRARRDELISRRNTFSTNDIDKIEEMLPDQVDNIRLIIDINNVAARRGLSIRNLQLGAISNSATPRSSLAVGASGDPLGSVTLGFSISASYTDFLTFLADIEHSLRLLDIERISFNVGTGNTDDYSFTIRTYWLR